MLLFGQSLKQCKYKPYKEWSDHFLRINWRARSYWTIEKEKVFVDIRHYMWGTSQKKNYPFETFQFMTSHSNLQLFSVNESYQISFCSPCNRSFIKFCMVLGSVYTMSVSDGVRALADIARNGYPTDVMSSVRGQCKRNLSFFLREHIGNVWLSAIHPCTLCRCST